MAKAKFSGYWMALWAGIICMVSLGFGYLTLSLYLPVLCTELQVGSSVMSVMFAVLAAVSMAASFLSGKIIQKIGLKKLIMIGCLSLLVGYAVMYFASNIIMVYLSAAFIGIALSWCGVICVGTVVPNWFIEKRGLILGLVMAASGVGGFIGNPIVSYLMNTSGWRTACLVTLGIMAVLLIPSMLAIKGRPEDLNQKPLGYDPSPKKEQAAAAGPEFKNAVGSPAFIFLCLTLLAFGMYVSGVNPHVAGIVTEKGFNIVFSGTALALISVTNTLGSILIGVINDKAGIRAVMTWMAVCGLAAMITLFISSSQPGIIIFALVFGLVMPASGSLVPMLTVSLFGMKSFSQLLGITNGIIGLVGIFSAVIIGIIHDVSGSYNTAVLVVGALLVLGYIAFLAAYRSSRNLL
jgi:MFS family permease